jgi:putative ABC transport system substrate-binding protein
MDLRWGRGDINRIRALAQELVGLQPDIILAAGTPATIALQRETRTIPIVFTVYRSSEFARDGGLLYYGPDPDDPYRGAATYVDRILRGAKPGDLPVQFPTKFEMVLNLKTRRSALRCRNRSCFAPTR